MSLRRPKWAECDYVDEGTINKPKTLTLRQYTLVTDVNACGYLFADDRGELIEYKDIIQIIKDNRVMSKRLITVSTWIDELMVENKRLREQMKSNTSVYDQYKFN